MGKWTTKGRNAAPPVVYTIFRPTNKHDPIPRDDATSIRKLKAEGTPTESQNILGWRVYTRKFRIYLPKDKSLQWRKDISHILQNKKVDSKTMESTIGRLNHAVHIIPQGRYFLNRLRDLQSTV